MTRDNLEAIRRRMGTYGVTDSRNQIMIDRAELLRLVDAFIAERICDHGHGCYSVFGSGRPGTYSREEAEAKVLESVVKYGN